MFRYGMKALALVAALGSYGATANIVTSIADEYDFVIVGGGLAGLVVGGRLSEEQNYTVLVLEAGGNGDEYRTRIDTPGLVYYESLGDIDWGFYTTPQPNINNTVMSWPRGKVLGGSSAVNGLYLVRPGEIEVNAWQSMLGDMDGADSWSWDSLYAAMKKSETFTPPSAAIAKAGDITWEASSHGTDGPIHYSWPDYTFPMIQDWSASAEAAGVPLTKDAYGGENWGAYVATSAINPANWTRSYSRTGYLDPLPPRINYNVLTNAQVTRLLFNNASISDPFTAYGVEYTSDNGTTMNTVKVKKEVILCGGAIGSPNILMHSGIGPFTILSEAGVEQLLNLPVGQYLQDHLSVSTTWNTSSETAGDLFNSGDSNVDFLSYVNDAIAYVNASLLFGDGMDDMKSTILSSLSALTPTLDHPTAAGYQTITNATAETIFTSPIGQIELLLGNTAGQNTIDLGATLQHPYSLGSITINSSDPLAPPVINPNYLANTADATILIAGLKLARQIAQTPPLSNLMTEVWPGENVQSDEDWDTWMRSNAYTEYHPCSTCAMLPRNQGGVVDATLKVYGTSNVRVADASVPPIEFSAHLMGSTYGLAEIAAEIIKADYAVDGTVKNKSASANPEGTLRVTGSKGGKGGSSAAPSGSTHPNSAMGVRLDMQYLGLASLGAGIFAMI